MTRYMVRLHEFRAQVQFGESVRRNGNTVTYCHRSPEMQQLDGRPVGHSLAGVRCIPWSYPASRHIDYTLQWGWCCNGGTRDDLKDMNSRGIGRIGIVFQEIILVGNVVGDWDVYNTEGGFWIVIN